MGRDGVIPKNIFAHLNKKHACPDYNVLIIGILACIGAFLLNYAECAQLINFGAFLAFMGVNVASVNEHFFKSTKKSFKTFFLYLLPAMLGFLFCLLIWINLPLKTFIIGGSWLLAGIIYLAFRTRGFREGMTMINFPSD
jgi:hypothetical protein